MVAYTVILSRQSQGKIMNKFTGGLMAAAKAYNDDVDTRLVQMRKRAMKK